MPSRIDHVIIAGPDLDALEQHFTSLGFDVTGGGIHPHLGTRNRLIILEESYIELLAIADPDRASPSLRRFIASGGGWVGYALQSDDIAAETDSLWTRGVDARGPTPGRLIRPDGSARGWQVTLIGSDNLWEAAFPLPFLIQHDTTGEAHRRELAGGGEPAPHPNGATAIAQVRFLGSEATSLAQRYRSTFDLREEMYTTQAEAAAERLTLQSGEQILFEAQARLDPDPLCRVMVVRARVTRLSTIERLRRHSGERMSEGERTLILPIPGVNAEIECTGPS